MPGLATSVKLAADRFSTGSLKTTLQATEVALVGLGAARVMVATGGSRSTAITGPVNGRLVRVALRPVELARFSPSVPVPVMPVTVTVQVASAPVGALMTPLAVPVRARTKFAALSPVMARLKVTV